jgi:hypothetical protein
MAMPPLELDHLVVAAGTLEQGVAWCEATLGVRPSAGGQHVFMGTHNRVFDISTARYPRAYLEIIAIDPSLPAPGRVRWFDLDDAAMRQRLAAAPQLVHWVARVDDVATAHAAMLADGIDCGRVIDAERGALRWRITVRDDGRRPQGGVAPALIQWLGAHPTDALPASDVRLASMSAAPDRFSIELESPRGRVALMIKATVPSMSS